MGASVVGATAGEGGESRRCRVARVFRDYDEQGIHRTGTKVDAENARWLVDRARSAGAQAKLIGFPHERIDPRECELRVESDRYPGVPLFDCSYTDAEGVEGRLGALGSTSEIGLGPLPPAPTTPEGRAFLRARRESRHRGLVGVTDATAYGIASGLTLVNADDFRKPFGPPVLQLPTELGPRLRAAAERGAPTRVICRVARETVQAFNVEAELPGREPQAAPLVVMTPRSGWWRCASERGGGVAAWLEILRDLAVNSPRRPVRFVASTGHELGHEGLEHFLAAHPDLPSRAHAWIHLGANFAAAGTPALRLQASDRELLELARSALARAGAPAEQETPVDQRPFGEARNISDGRGRFVSLLGMSGLFHHPQDRWPDAVDLERTLQLINALTEIARALSA